MSTKERRNSTSQGQPSPPKPMDLPSALYKGYKRPASDGRATHSNGKSPSLMEKAGQGLRNLNLRLGCNLGNIVGFFMVALTVVAAIFYIQGGQPLFLIDAPPTFPSQPLTDRTGASLSEPAFVILGQYNNEIFTFNGGVSKVYAYNPQTLQERQVCKLARFDAFRWHESGKVLLLSYAYNTLGGIYILDLTKPDPEPILITDRESGVRFPRNLSIDTSLPLDWSEAGDAVAFVVRDAQNNTESLFVFDVEDKRLIYTPARNLDRISSTVWVNGDSQLALVVISDGQEGRYLVDKLGGGFTTWSIED